MVNISWKYIYVSCIGKEKVHREFDWAQSIIQEMSKDAVTQNIINKQIRCFSSTWICIMTLEVHSEKNHLLQLCHKPFQMQRPSYRCNSAILWHRDSSLTQQLQPTQLTSAELYQWWMSLTNKRTLLYPINLIFNSKAKCTKTLTHWSYRWSWRNR